MRHVIAFIAFATVCWIHPSTARAQPNPKLEAWNAQLRGANGFNRAFNEQWFADAHAAGIRFCRLGLGKAKGEGRDFLLGNADDFRGIPARDLAHVNQIIDWAEKHEVRLLIAPLSLPGARWSQQNGRKFDPRLWKEVRYHEQSAAFWRELATALRNRRGIIGYEILNEPSPQRALGLDEEWNSDLDAWEAQAAGTPADVNRLYRTVIRAIREVDPTTPIVVSSSFFGFAGTMRYLKPLNDPAVIYTFHTYEPYAFTNFRTNQKRFSYPGPVLTGSNTEVWNRARIERHVAGVAEWAATHGIPPQRILVGEFGCDRRVPGTLQYFTDSIDVFNRHGWHWAFYAFREDEWDALDYELGEKPLPWSYWQAIERGEKPAVTRRDNPIWRVLQRGLQGEPLTTRPATNPAQ